MVRYSDLELQILGSWRVARLATSDARGVPSVVPICFAFDGHHIYSVLDKKPKTVQPNKLKRVLNILSNPQASLVLDHYDEEWDSLWYILVTGTAEIIYEGTGQQDAVMLLRKKYEQYREMDIEDSPVIRITPRRVATWGNPGGPKEGPVGQAPRQEQ